MGWNHTNVQILCYLSLHDFVPTLQLLVKRPQLFQPHVQQRHN